MFEIIVACDAVTGGIGRNGKLPWHLPDDLKRFRYITSNAPQGKQNAVIMGRNTWESLPEKHRPLVGRLNIVLTHRSILDKKDGVLVYASFDSVLQDLKLNPSVHNVFVIGGQQLYKEALNHPECNVIRLTLVHPTIDRTDDVYDAWFPLKSVLNNHLWVPRSGEYILQHQCEYLTLDRVSLNTTYHNA